MHRATGRDMKPDYLGRDVAVTFAVDIEAMLRRAGFLEPTVYYRALLISAWRSVLHRG